MPIFSRLRGNYPLGQIRGLGSRFVSAASRVSTNMEYGAMAVGAVGLYAGASRSRSRGSGRFGSAASGLGWGAATYMGGMAAAVGVNALRGNEAVRTFMSNVTRPGVVKGMAGRMFRSLRG